MFMSLLLYPTDTIRRRMMMQSGRKEKLYSGYVDCVKKTWKKEGLRGGYKGFGANLLRSIGGALLLAMYEEYVNFL
jgi:solute carrier family 25 (mitochondrial adenine nucleotide translocator), member 4/5/6/31